MELCDLDMSSLATRLRDRSTSCQEIMGSVLDRVDQTEPDLNAYITLVSREELLKAAKKADEMRANLGADNVLKYLGMPIAIKDIICTEGLLTTCGSRMLNNFVPPYDATVIRALKKQGFIIIGKTNCDEFAMGATNETSFYGRCANPWHMGRISGGSSGGSAVAVAAGQTIVALGTDTGGSIRLPSSFCGTVGLKPTYGRVSRYGVVAYASSFEQVGPITKSVRDTAELMEIISGHDVYDSTSTEVSVDNYSRSLEEGVRGLKLGKPKEYFVEGLQPDVKKALDAALAEFENLGAEIVDISLPHTEYAVPAYYILVPAEASSNLARFDGVKFGHRAEGQGNLEDMVKQTRAEGFGFEVKKRLMLGTYVLSAGYYEAYYSKAQKARTVIKNDFIKAFEKVDAIVCPTSPNVASKFGEVMSDPLQLYLSDIFTGGANLSGVPALSLPCGFDGEGLPIGLQIMGKHFDEKTILRIAYAYEQATTWRLERASKSRASGQ